MQHLTGSDVLILGLGSSGLAMARWCTRFGARVSVWDSRESPPQAEALREHCPQALLASGELAAERLHGLHWVLKSPGLAPHDARIAPVWRGAAEAGIRTGGELDLFVLALAELETDAGYAPQVLAITGTNGKTTTAALTGLLVERAGRSVAVAGNIGPTMLDTLGARLDAGPLPEVWVLELSSFQLADLSPRLAGDGGFDPAAAVVLNVTQDHLDWHGDMAAYAAAKARVYGATTTLVINRDDPRVCAMEPPAPAARAPRGTARAAPRHVVRYGLDVAQRPGDFGLLVEGGMAWLVRALPQDDAPRRRRRGDGDGEEIHLQRLMPADALRLRGRHNASNALAALALACAIGCPLAPMLHGLREYRGEPHRVEFVARIGEVEAYDDTKGTNVGATVAALRGLGEERAPARLVLILGGDGKGQDFAPLAEPVAAHARAVALIGRDASTIHAALASTGVALQLHATLEAATRWCFEQARPGDAVLLSPACASLDMFRNYAHRGEVFVRTVHELAAERGEVSS